MRRVVAMLLGALLVYAAACDENKTDPYSDYLEFSYVDTVLVGDTIQNDEPAQVVHFYPMGCNHLERIESSERGDTLEVAALYHFIVRSSAPCAHGSGLDTIYYSLHFSASGAHYLSYLRNETTKIVQPVFVEE